jgi:hypothetical protein
MGVCDDGALPDDEPRLLCEEPFGVELTRDGGVFTSLGMAD